MSKKEDDAYEAWLKEVESTLSEDGQKKLREVLSEDKARQIFKGPLREADYYRRVEEVNKARAAAQEELEAEKAKLNTWWNEEKPKNERLLAQLNAAREQLKDLGVEDDALPAASTTPKTSEEVEQIKLQLAQIAQILPRALGDIAEVTHRISKEKFEISPREVLDYSFKQNVDPLLALEALTAGERSDREKARMAEMEKKWKEEGRREALANVAPPDQLRLTTPEAVSRLFTPDSGTESVKEFGSDAAVAEFRKMTIEGGL